MAKLTFSQRDQLKRLVLDCIVSRLTVLETQRYVRDRMNGVEISIDYLNHLKADLKHGYRKQLEYMQKDRFAYINGLFFDRVEEVNSLFH